jgi:hypothetical protein
MRTEKSVESKINVVKLSTDSTQTLATQSELTQESFNLAPNPLQSLFISLQLWEYEATTGINDTVKQLPEIIIALSKAMIMEQDQEERKKIFAYTSLLNQLQKYFVEFLDKPCLYYHHN